MVYNYLPGLVPPAETPPEQFSQAPTDVSADHVGHMQKAIAGTGTTERTSLSPIIPGLSNLCGYNSRNFD